MKQSRQRHGFTILEILIVVGILAILLSIVAIKLKPFQRKEEAYNIKRQADIRSIEHGVTRFAIDTLSMPPGTPIGGASVAKPICREGITGAACTASPVNGVDLSGLIPQYLSLLPVDPAMTGSTITGYKLYSDGEEIYATAPLLGKNPSTQNSQNSNTPASTIVGYWKLDDATGTVAADSSGNNRNGALLNGATWTAGLFTGGLQFDGSNDEVSIPDHASLDGFTSFTLGTWIRPYTWKDAQIAGISDAYDLRMRSDGKIQYSVKPFLASTISQSVAPINQWTHLALVYNGSKVSLYVNGVLDTSTNATGTVAVTTTPLRIGASANFHGKIDEVRLHSIALSDTEIGELAASGFTGSQVAYWPMDNGAGTSATDASGNGRTASLLNGPTWTGTSTAPTNYSNGYSLKFDGVNDYGRVTSNASLDFRTRTAFSASTWVYAGTGMPNGGLVGIWSAGSQGWMLYTINNTVHFTINSGMDIAATILGAGWYHVAGVWDGQTMKIYLNGTLANSRANTVAPNSASDLIIGGYYASGDTGGTPAYLFNEKIDDLRIFNRALSQAEVRSLATGNALP